MGTVADCCYRRGVVCVSVCVSQTWNWVIGSPGQWVILDHLSRRGHRVIILTRCETRVFPVFEKNAKNAKLTIQLDLYF